MSELSLLINSHILWDHLLEGWVCLIIYVPAKTSLSPPQPLSSEDTENGRHDKHFFYNNPLLL